MSSTALHWLTAAQLRRLYRQLAGRVRPGGIFLNADGMRFRPESVRLTRLARKLRTQRVRESPRRGETWDAWWLAVGREPALAAEMAEHGRRFPHGHERTPTLDFEGHRAALRRAGFREAEGVFGMWEYRILAAIR
jgi:SAM-dependent methyltransferase